MHPHEYEKRVESGKSEQDKLIAAKQYGNVEIVARILGVSISFLNKARMNGGGDGPPYVKFGRNVRYSIPEVLAWAASRSRTSTSEFGRGGAIRGARRGGEGRRWAYRRRPSGNRSE